MNSRLSLISNFIAHKDQYQTKSGCAISPHLILRVATIEFFEALDDVKREINEDAISLALDLVIAEEDVGFEVHQSLVHDIHVIIAQRPLEHVHL